jgi:hypothetical protein
MIVVNKTVIDFGFLSIHNSRQSAFVVSNEGVANLVVSDIISSNVVFSVSDTSFTLIPGESKTITATFSPVALMIYNGTFIIKSNDSDVTIALTGKCVSAGIYVNKNSINYGNTTVKASKTESVLVSNISTEEVDLLLSSVSTTSPSFKETVDAFRISKGDALRIPVTFTPLSSGNFSGILQIANNDTSLPLVEVELIGMGILAPNISTTTSMLNFGTVGVGQTIIKTFKIHNSGDLNLIINNIVLSNSSFSVSPSNGIVLPNHFLSINVAFTPTNTENILAKLTISNNDIDSPLVTVDLQGKGISSSIVISPSSLNFGNITINTPEIKSFNIFNDSIINLEVIDIEVVGSANFSINESLPFVVTSSKSIDVTFNPNDLGIKEAILNVVSNDLNTPVSPVDVRGIGVSPDIAIQPNVLNFLDVAVGSSSSLSVTILNLGQGVLRISGINSTNPVFVPDTYNFEIQPRQSRSVTITFSPVAMGTKNAVITFISNDPDTPNINLSVVGYGAFPIIDVSHSIVDFGYAVVNNAKTETITIYNSGRAPLNVAISSGSSLFTTSVTSLTVQQNIPQTFDIAFLPNAVGNVSSIITLLTNDPDNSTINISVLGNSVLSSKIIVSPDSLSFNDVAMGSSQTLDLNIVNQGSQILTFTTSFVNPVRPGRPPTFSAVPISGTLAISDSLVLSVTFRPNDPEQLSGTLKILSNDFSEPVLEVPLHGTGKPAILFWSKINTATWIPREVYTIATSLTNIIDPLISALDFTKQILDIVKIFIIDISDAMKILLEQIKKTIDDFINDLSATGLYILYVLPGKPGITPYAYPQYFRELPKSSFNIFDPNNPSWFDSVKGGYSAFIAKIVQSFDDPADGRRPQFSDDAMVGAYVMMFDSGTVGPDDVAKFIRSIQKLMKLFRSPFRVAFEPPSNISAFAGNKEVRVTFTPSTSILPKEYFIFRSEVQGGDVVTYEYEGKNYPCHDENGNLVKSYELVGVTNVKKQLADIMGINEDNADNLLSEVSYAAKQLSSVVLNNDPFRLVFEDTTVVNDRTYYYVVAAGYTTLSSYRQYKQIKNVLSSDFDKKIVSTIDPETFKPVEVEINPKSITQTKIMAIGGLSAEVSAKPVNASFEVFGGLARCRNFRCGFDQDITEFHRIVGAEAPDFIIIANTPIAGSVRIRISRNGNDFIANPYSYRVDYTPKIKEGNKTFQGTTSKIFIKSRYYFKIDDVLTITYKFKKDLKISHKSESAVLDQYQTFLTLKKPIDSTSVQITYNNVVLSNTEVMVLNDKDGRIKVNKAPGTTVIINYDYYPDFYNKDYFRCIRPEYSRYFFDITKCDGGSTLCTGYDNANCFYNNGTECTNPDNSERKVLTGNGFISEDIPFKLFWDPISCQNGMMQQRCDGYSKTFPRYSPKIWPDWSSVRLSALGLFPKIEEIMKIMQNLLDSLLAGTEKMSSTIQNFIDLLQKKIDSLRNLLETIRSFLTTITEDFVIPDLYFLRIPYARGGNEYLKTSIENAVNGPVDEPTAYTAGVVLVYGTPGLGNALQLFFG